ncbi:50S ribosomal protein L21, chloroplastic [Amaranthus tricolor]|uniref:50S ribosomal protein L21, chloroplastic n=1 Tax=Amaranthus tricolor TaxID=29722 RepID=UPI002582EA32|nr:50S ribosomal protein L21, chloroplastic [Amaranthus tricolor]
MASATMAFSCSSSIFATIKHSHNQNPLSFSKPFSNFISPPILPFSQRLSLSSVAANGSRSIADLEDIDPETFKRSPFDRPKLSDVLPEDIEIPKPGSPEYEAIREKLFPKKDPPPAREEIFAVVMIGSRQYIVIPGRWIFTQRLKGANVNDKIILNKVLLVGTKDSTYIGKPVVTNAAVHAVVEEQLLDDKVIVFKYKKKKNYRRTIGHRQPITRIKITGITGYEDYPASKLEAEAKAEAVSS